jgi:peptidoglycan hydrolase-like protein with peptidoglycan-binding domain
MKNLGSKLVFLTTILYILACTAAFANNSVSISQPANGAKISGPVKICLATSGVAVEPAKNGVHDGKGHHHILVDVDVPEDLSKPIGKDANHVHMGDGSKCKTLNLAAGKHTIRALFAKGNHVPYNPVLTAKVSIEVLASVSITNPPKGAMVTGPVKVCLKTSGVAVEPAKNGSHDGKGHHHILVDVDVPRDLSKPIGKDANHIHMGDGSTCKEIKLTSGKHTIRALFAMGNHVPYDPALTAEVTFNVK